MGTNFGMTGVETFIMQLCAAQRRLGMAPSVTLELDNRAEVARSGAALGVPVTDFPRAPLASPLPGKLGAAALRARRVRRLVQQLRDADVLHMHSVGIVGLDALVAAAIRRLPAVIVTHHLTMTAFAPQRNRTSDLTLALERRLAHRAVMPYAAAADELVAHGVPAERVAAIPFCCDEELFGGAITPPAPGSLTLVMAARLFPGKGQELLLAAVASLRPRYPGLRLLLVGEGPTRGALEAEIRRLELGDAVELRGLVPHELMPTVFAEGHVIVLPSSMPGETFPISLLEGMSMGMPAIGSRWFGIPDIIVDGESGFVVEPGSVDALARAIEHYLADPAAFAAASKNARARAKAHFTGAAVAGAYAALYAEALS
jgi:glycosyltransferase involved in cell wall biosynthesis